MRGEYDEGGFLLGAVVRSEIFIYFEEEDVRNRQIREYQQTIKNFKDNG